MNPLRPLRPLLLAALCVPFLPACKTTRTVLSGPRNVSEGVSDYNPEAEARNAEIGQMAANKGMVGSAFGGGSGFNRRFGSRDPYGYGEEGLNAMSDKVYGGDTSLKEMKSFTQTKDFLTRRYSNTRELEQKGSVAEGMRSWLGGRKANADKLARETGQGFTGSQRILDNKNSNYGDRRAINGRTSREDGRMASTKDYYPAKKVLDAGADEPKIINQGDAKTNDAVMNLIRSRPRDNPATVDDIRELLGKSE